MRPLIREPKEWDASRIILISERAKGLPDSTNVAGKSGKISRHDSAGFWRQMFFNFFRGNIQRVFVHITKHRARTAHKYSLRITHKCHGRQNYLVSRADAKGVQGQVQGGCAGVNGNDMLCAGKFCQCFSQTSR